MSELSIAAARFMSTMTKLIRLAMLMCITASTPGCCLTDAVWDPANSRVAGFPTILGAYRDADGRQRMLLTYSAGDKDINPKRFYTSIALQDNGLAVYPFGFTAATTRPRNDEYANQRYLAAYADLAFMNSGTAERIIAAHSFVKPIPSLRVFEFIRLFDPVRHPCQMPLSYQVSHAGADLKIEPPNGTSLSGNCYIIVPQELRRNSGELVLERIKAAAMTPPAFAADFAINTVALTVVLFDHP